MRELILKSGVTEQSYDGLVKNLDKVTDEKVEEIYDFLSALGFIEYTNALKIVNLVPKKMWESYELYGVTGLREQGLLKEALKLLKKGWYDGKKTLRTKSDQGTAGASEMSIRSKEA